MPKAVAASGLVTASWVWADNNVNVINPDGTYLAWEITTMWESD